ncbi:hypothetical protein [Paraoerskovia sediminicola]|uniref:hypothetical protein n=1 Tax=Paraoerskovia sediminicola TaxID=1138587 RepID=UPI002572A8A0|nr:hypothetical protein [Paraoerskovia sediminicola]
MLVVVLDALDAESVHEGEVPDAVRMAGDVGVPVVVVCRTSEVGRRESGAAGIAGVYPLGLPDVPRSDGAAGADPDGARADRHARVARIARTWTPVHPAARVEWEHVGAPRC